MTFSAPIADSANATDGKETATHKMPHSGALARAGANGNVEIWGLGRWLCTDHPNWMLRGDHPHWFVKLADR